MNKELSEFKKKMREVFANYRASEGCSCCRNHEDYEKHEKEIGKMLNVKKYSDGSGYDFTEYKTKK
jgi:hypothetical protein